MTALKSYYDACRAVFPLLPQWFEEVDTCITPEFKELNSGSLPVFCIPQAYTLAPDEADHETGHAYQKLLERQQPGVDFLARYWTFRGFPGTWQEAQAQADTKTDNERFQLLPAESWAEAFARGMDASHHEKTLNWGMEVDSPTMQLWFRSQDIAHPVLPATPVVDPHIEWVGPAALVNFAPGRSGNPIAMIVDHWIGGGTLDTAIAYFKTPRPDKPTSSHYIVGTDGRIVQVVFDADTAYHAGTLAVNFISIGIEHEVTPTLPATDALYHASAWLHRYLADKYNLALEVGVTVKPHRSIVSTTCPGTLDLNRIVEEAEDMAFTQADRDMLARIKDILEAREAMVWGVRAQRGLDIERGKPYDPEKPPIDQRVIVK